MGNFSFKLKPGASYATDRKRVTYFPRGGNSDAPQGVKVIKSSVSGNAWLDPTTVKLFYGIQSLDLVDKLRRSKFLKDQLG